MEKLKLYVISHTHWDREWYQTFQHYRYRLVRMMDDLINGLEQDEEYKVFHLDGQTIVLKDYLEIRPEMAERLTALIQKGRIRIGPWYVMPDEFLVSGESLIKNLQMGHDICKQYKAEPMKNGYVTDIFGHNSQLPQLLNGFDISSATLYRGIGDYEKDAFLWRSPDGSEVVTAKLESEHSYSNFYFAVRWPYEENGFDEADAVKRMKVLVSRARKMAASNMVLMMDGVDHGAMEPKLSQMLCLFEHEIPDIECIHANIEDYFSKLDKAELKVFEGPLYAVGREGSNNQLLKNVLSSMVQVKQANDQCETFLTTVSEPLNALCEMHALDEKKFREDDYSLAPRRRYLNEAWQCLISNHPHDSICGCSLSEVHRDNMYRYRQAQEMAEISAQDCMNVIARNIRCAGKHQEAILLYNPSQLPVHGVQVFFISVARHKNANRRFYDSSDRLIEVQVLEEQDELNPDSRLRQLVRFDLMSKLRVAADLDIPALGYTVLYSDHLENIWSPAQDKAYSVKAYYPPRRLVGTQMPNHYCIDNGVLLIELNEKGLLNVVDQKSGRTYSNLHLLENCSDVGDGWNWRHVAYDAVIYSDHCLRQFSVLVDGPMCTVWKLVYELQLPVAADLQHNKRSDVEHVQRVTTFLTVPKNSEVLYFRTELENRTENNRLRVLFPTDLQEDVFFTKTPFDFQKWEVQHKDTRDFSEEETRVHPMQGICRIGSEKAAVALYSKGLYEVEVTDDEERALALTLFRAAQTETGTDHPDDIKMQRKMNFEYVVSFANGSNTQSVLEGEQYRSGIQTFRFEQNDAAEALASRHSFISVSACEKIVSHCSEQNSKYYLRIYDVSGKQEKITITFPKKIARMDYVNLKQEPMHQGEFLENTATVVCPPHKIVTIRIELAQGLKQ